jgi:hypothetical protein
MILHIFELSNMLHELIFNLCVDIQTQMLIITKLILKFRSFCFKKSRE